VGISPTFCPTIVLALHPGTVETSLTEGYRAAHKATPDEAAKRLLKVIETRILSDTGKFFDYAGLEIPW
jgi:hypothetical protein